MQLIITPITKPILSKAGEIVEVPIILERFIVQAEENSEKEGFVAAVLCRHLRRGFAHFVDTYLIVPDVDTYQAATLCILDHFENDKAPVKICVDLVRMGHAYSFPNNSDEYQAIYEDNQLTVYGGII